MTDRVHELELEVLPQPNDTTCGPTCLHAVYRYLGDDIPLSQVISEVTPLAEGGTLAVLLACHALRRGYGATIYTYNLHTFDPTWFEEGTDLNAKLEAQLAVKTDPKLTVTTKAYLEFFRLGGQVKSEELTAGLIQRFLEKKVPVLTGISATYLYSCRREYEGEYNDVRGEPIGHFVVLSGYDPAKGQVLVADPLQDNPGFGSQYYWVGIDRVLNSILLGILTYDANLLVLSAPEPEG